MTTPWPLPPALEREHLVAASDARLADDPLPATPPIAGPPAPGRFELIDDRGVFLREHPVTGPVADRPVTLYLHGLGGSSTNFDALGTLLAGFTRGIAVDLPGAGRSDPPPAGRYSAAGDARLLARLAERLSPVAPVHVVGNSLGGMVAVQLAARYPDRVASLTLISPAVPDLRLTDDRGADPRLAVLLAPGTLPVATRRLAAIDPLRRAQGMAALCFGHPESLTDADLQAAAAELGWRYPLPWAHSSMVKSLRWLMRGYLRPGRWSFSALAKRIAVPVLVVWGTRDRLVDPMLAVPTAAAFADSRLLVLSGCGHVPQMERPADTARAVLARWQDAAGRTDTARRTGGGPQRIGTGAVPTSGVPPRTPQGSVATS